MIRAVLFDLDGTLLDSAPDLVGTLNYLRASLGLKAMPLEELRHFASRGAVGLIKAGMPPCDEETLAAWRESFLGHYRQNSWVHSRPFAGVDQLLAELTSRGLPWGIVTNKVEHLSLPILERAGWLSSVSTVICGDSVPNCKPHPDPIFAACRKMGVDPVETLMVGDDLRDVEAGKRAGSHTAFALYGYSDQQARSLVGGDTALIETPQQVLDLLAGGAGGR